MRLFKQSISSMCISPCRDELEERHSFYENKAADLEENEETKQTTF